MAYIVEDIGKDLKKARQGKGLSQRALSAASGVPQGHISKIETGTVDLRLSSLIELARILDLELMLVPRKYIPAVQSIVRQASADQNQRPAYTLDEDDDA
ncbi:helix-turn-helix domain-containing protein [Taklimakanibacter deserti]|uniref:helix-turn-helix domain-containing protein n=1 Tax=Taklimakanibacter deserti TaxID=2267839 RepID=UPI000E658D6E